MLKAVSTPSATTNKRNDDTTSWGIATGIRRDMSTEYTMVGKSLGMTMCGFKGRVAGGHASKHRAPPDWTATRPKAPLRESRGLRPIMGREWGEIDTECKSLAPNLELSDEVSAWTALTLLTHFQQIQLDTKIKTG